MREILKMTGALLIIALLVAHFFLIALFVAPTNKLLGMMLEADAGFLAPQEVPEPVEDFLVGNHVPVDGDYQLVRTSKGRLILSILELRRNYLMQPAEQIALDANLLNYGEGLVGIRKASEFYYRKDLAELSDAQWINLVNLQKIFARNN